MSEHQGVLVSELREGDVFGWRGAQLTVVRIHGWSGKRTIHLEAWRQNEGVELVAPEGLVVALVARLDDAELARREKVRSEERVAAFDELLRHIDAGASEGEWDDGPEWTDEDLEINTVTNAAAREAELVARIAELEQERDAWREEFEKVRKVPLTARWQEPLAEWQRRELPCEDEGRQRLRVALGVAEEAGEVARCVLKGDQGIRGGASLWDRKCGGEIGDVAVYLMQLCTLMGFDFEDCVDEAVGKVLARRFATAEVAP